LKCRDLIEKNHSKTKLHLSSNKRTKTSIKDLLLRKTKYMNQNKKYNVQDRDKLHIKLFLNALNRNNYISIEINPIPDFGAKS
jgi:hypothetical protein